MKVKKNSKKSNSNVVSFVPFNNKIQAHAYTIVDKETGTIIMMGQPTPVPFFTSRELARKAMKKLAGVKIQKVQMQAVK